MLHSCRCVVSAAALGFELCEIINRGKDFWPTLFPFWLCSSRFHQNLILFSLAKPKESLLRIAFHSVPGSLSIFDSRRY